MVMITDQLLWRQKTYFRGVVLPNLFPYEKQL